MPAHRLAPALTFLSAWPKVSPVIPLRTFLRTASEALRPSPPRPHVPVVRTAQAAVLAAGGAERRHLATLLHEPHPGPVPTIVLGGFVPDATEQVFLLRGHLAKFGSLYYLNYPADGFSLDLLCAQLDDLTEELRRLGRPPVILAVSFGGGVLLEWLRRARGQNRPVAAAGLVFISPVANVADLLTPGEPKPATLLGRALQPWLCAGGAATAATIEKSRAIFARMFEAGAQNRGALAFLLTRAELEGLRRRVLGTIRRVTATGARERVQTLLALPVPAMEPLSPAPALVLYAEKEDAVLTADSPTRRRMAAPGWFPCGTVRVIANPGGPPVQHASLIFHGHNFLPDLTRFYRALKGGKIPRAA